MSDPAGSALPARRVTGVSRVTPVRQAADGLPRLAKTIFKSRLALLWGAQAASRNEPVSNLTL